jgi:signal transduction histidine kinase
MQRRMFLWFGLSIILTMIAIAVVMVTLGGASFQPWKRDMSRVQNFFGNRFAVVWDDTGKRDELARAMQRDLDVDVVLFDAQGAKIASYGGSCENMRLDAAVVRDGVRLGEVQTCSNRHEPRYAWRLLLGIVTACAVLWAASGKIARRLTRPLDELVRVANDLGAGDFSARVRTQAYGEIGMLGCTINEMAARIEKQVNDQRELLAAVSHEIRTPLTRIRLLTEMARDRSSFDDETIAEIESEVVEIDRLVSELLASSRLQFSAMTVSRLDASEAAARALERAGVDKSKLVVDAPEGTSFEADATLVARALANLIDNAERHGEGLVRMHVVSSDERVRFEAEDAGPGFAPGDERRVFDPFVQSPTSSQRAGVGERGSLGLGLALVKRIADAHDGSVEAKNRDGGGALVAIELPRKGRVPAAPKPRTQSEKAEIPA